jgi:hypothetical protein
MYEVLEELGKRKERWPYLRAALSSTISIRIFPDNNLYLNFPSIQTDAQKLLRIIPRINRHNKLWL